MATKVKLRQKAISGNRQSLYLDFYPPVPHPETGEPTRREFLGLYLMDNPKHVLDKQGNKETMQRAEQIRQKRDNQLNKPEVYTGYELEQLKIKEQGEKSFIEYFKGLMDKRKASNHDNWVSAFHYLEKFTGGSLAFNQVTQKWCNEFRDFLLTAPTNHTTKKVLSQNSAVSYFNKIKATLKQAYKDGLLPTDINAKVAPVKQAETQRQFLSLDELKALQNTPCTLPVLKQAALFSALTGLRFSDIEKMEWGEVGHSTEAGYFIQYTQQKTKGTELLPISEGAFNLLGSRGVPMQKVFAGLKYSAYTNLHLAKWVMAAGITKNITFHCFRHTFATLQLSLGTDIYTVSKMLGHRELKTTQVYAKVVDKAKREAADKISLE
jgi:integrase